MAPPRVVLCAEEKSKWQREALARRSTSSAELPSPTSSVLGWLLGPSFPPSDPARGGPSDSPEVLVLSSVAAFSDSVPSTASGTGSREQESVKKEIQALRSLLPGGISVVGFYCCCGAQWDEAVLQRSAALASEVVSGLRGLGETPAGDGDRALIVIQLDSEGGDIKASAYSSHGGIFSEATWSLYEGGRDKLWDAFWGSHTLLSLSLAFHLPLYSSEKEDIEQSLGRALAPVEDSILSPSASWILSCIAGTAQQARLASTLVTPGAPQLPTLRDLAGSSGSQGQLAKSKQQQQPAAGSKKKFPWDFVATVVVSPTLNAASTGTPAISFYKAPAGVCWRRLRLELSTAACAPRDMAAADAIRTLLAPAAAQQLRAIRYLLASGGLKTDPKICAYQFGPEGFVHPVTALYSLAFGEAEAVSVEQRKALHRRLGLPLDRPLLRTANALSPGLALLTADDSAAARLAGAKRLQNVHIGLPPSGIPGAKVWQVQGSYDYYHYMQDRIDDSGWGCAYRSLQTIVSWFRNQQYTQVEVPSHRVIQETLVEIGDKEAGFVGSSRWIGAIELSYVLDQLLGVTCKVLTVQSGADMPTKARELARHFETHGTPVMIGGGVLAYTLLGIDYNELTGECAFLILDPHYMGGEDLKSIRNGGWCGWKKTVTASGKDFFVRDAFYNLLLPQRPQTV